VNDLSIVLLTLFAQLLVATVSISVVVVNKIEAVVELWTQRLNVNIILDLVTGEISTEEIDVVAC
jgi:hypothetical protein